MPTRNDMPKTQDGSTPANPDVSLPGAMASMRLSPSALMRILAELLSLNLLFSVAQAYSPLSDSSLRSVPSGQSSDFDIHTGTFLSPFLIPRVPGTEGHAKVQEHIVSFFQARLPSWTVEWHNTTSKTPATGPRQIPFSNLILRRGPPGVKEGDVAWLTLAAHYDSMYRPEGFIGATDSAVPCALLMHVAQSVDEALTRKWEKEGEGDGLEDLEMTGVQILFLDGEEAWVSWTEEDSLYGSRALVEHWESTVYPPPSTYPNPLSAISLFVLLDLLGDANPHVPSYFSTTHWAYQHLSSLEDRMRKLDLLETRPRMQFLPEKDKRPEQFTRGFIADDHVPFMRRGVDILHVIPTPFPKSWHTLDDDAEHLDGATVRDWARIVTGFVAEWMELDGVIGSGHETEKGFARDEL